MSGKQSGDMSWASSSHRKSSRVDNVAAQLDAQLRELLKPNPLLASLDQIIHELEVVETSSKIRRAAKEASLAKQEKELADQQAKVRQMEKLRQAMTEKRLAAQRQVSHKTDTNMAQLLMHRREIKEHSPRVAQIVAKLSEHSPAYRPAIQGKNGRSSPAMTESPSKKGISSFFQGSVESPTVAWNSRSPQPLATSTPVSLVTALSNSPVSRHPHYSKQGYGSGHRQGSARHESPFSRSDVSKDCRYNVPSKSLSRTPFLNSTPQRLEAGGSVKRILQGSSNRTRDHQSMKNGLSDKVPLFDGSFIPRMAQSPNIAFPPPFSKRSRY